MIAVALELSAGSMTMSFWSEIICHPMFRFSSSVTMPSRLTTAVEVSSNSTV